MNASKFIIDEEEKMFKSIGKKLKELATVTCYMGIGGSFIAFLVLQI